jgi:hypothetical protein
MTAAEVELPKRLTTDSEDGREQVPVDMAATMNYAPEDIDKLKDVLGMSTFTGARLRAIRDVGLNVEAFGFLRYLKGGTAMTVESILQVTNELTKIVLDPGSSKRDKKEAAAVIASLSNAFSKVSTGAVKSDRDVAEVAMQKDEQKRNIFRPGVGQSPIINIPSTS